MCSQNAENAISETQISKILQGDMPLDPPRSLVPSALAPPIFHQVSATDSLFIFQPPRFTDPNWGTTFVYMNVN